MMAGEGRLRIVSEAVSQRSHSRNRHFRKPSCPKRVLTNTFRRGAIINGSIPDIDNHAGIDEFDFVARNLRVEYPGAIYHVMNRDDRREPIFRDKEDRRQFIATLGEACGKTGWQVQALCLMDNHFHLVEETPQANLVAGMNLQRKARRWAWLRVGRLPGQMKEQMGAEDYGVERQEAAEAQAEGMVEAELRRRH